MKLARKIGCNPALPQFELEIMPGVAVEDDQLADVTASNLASHGRPTATAPMGGPQDPWTPIAPHKGIDALRAAEASILPFAPSVATNLTTIMIAERIAKAVCATDGTLGGVPVLEIAAAGVRGAGSHNHRNQVTAAHLDGQ